MSKTLEERQAEIDEIAISTGLCTREQLAEARRLDALSPPEWLAHEISLDYKKTELYAGKIVKDIRLIGNGQEVITFTDGARLLYSVENPYTQRPKRSSISIRGSIGKRRSDVRIFTQVFTQGILS